MVELRRGLTWRPSYIYEQSLFEVKRWFENQWEQRVETPELRVAVSSSYAGEQIIKLLGVKRTDSDAPLDMPYLLIVPVQRGISQGRWNTFALRTLGLRTGLRIDGIERREHLSPIDVGLGLKFVTNDINEASIFSQIMEMNAPDAVVRVVQAATGFYFDCHLNLGDTVDIPQPADPSGNSAEPARLECTSTVILHTYTGTTEQRKVIRRVTETFKSPTPRMDIEQLRVANFGSPDFVQLSTQEIDVFRLSAERLAALGIVQNG